MDPFLESTPIQVLLPPRGTVGGADSIQNILVHRIIHGMEIQVSRLMPCLSRQRSSRTVRPSDQSEFASAGDRIAAMVHTQVLVCTLGPSTGAALVR